MLPSLACFKVNRHRHHHHHHHHHHQDFAKSVKMLRLCSTMTYATQGSVLRKGAYDHHSHGRCCQAIFSAILRGCSAVFVDQKGRGAPIELNKWCPKWTLQPTAAKTESSFSPRIDMNRLESTTSSFCGTQRFSTC